MSASGSPAVEVDVLIVGAGFGGCYSLKLLRDAGFKTKLVEAGTTLGGVWAWNRYPGARVDCEFPYYGYSDPAIWDTFTWKERYPSHEALRDYFQHTDKVWDLSKDIELRTRVVEAKFRDGGWDIKTSEGKTYRCKWFISATGTSFKQYIPEFEGRDKFKGIMHHSSLWPEESVDLNGKRIAVIGAGSTGIQVVQEAAKVGSQVTQFIRSPNFSLPMRQRQISEEEIVANKAYMPHIFKKIRNTHAGLAMESNGRNVQDDTPEERQAVWENQWNRGGFNWSLASYANNGTSEEANKLVYKFWVEKTRARMSDPQKRDLLAPLEQPYFIGTKRPSLEQDYYEMCDQPHVDITNSPITEFNETGISTEEKHRDFDIIVICTGYDAVTGGLRTMGIKGKDGTDLDQKWQNGVSTHLGMMVNGFPNMYMIYGPQAPTSFTNGPPFIELQCEWIRDLLSRQRDEKLDTLEAKQDAEDAWKQSCADIANMTLLSKTNSWYMGANVPGKKREFLLYLGGIPTWHKACVEAMDGWKGFDVNSVRSHL